VVHPAHVDRQITDKKMLADNLLRSVANREFEGVEKKKMMIENLPPRPWYLATVDDFLFHGRARHR